MRHHKSSLIFLALNYRINQQTQQDVCVGTLFKDIGSTFLVLFHLWRNVMKKLCIFLVGILFCAFVGTVQADNAPANESADSPSVVVLPDCSTVLVTSSYHGVNAGGEDLPVSVVDNSFFVTEGDPACDGTACALDGDLADDGVRVDDITQRNSKDNNATPAKNGKKTTEVDCDGCDSASVMAEVGPTERKNSHFDIHLESSANVDLCKSGFNTHTKTEG